MYILPLDLLDEARGNLLALDNHALAATLVASHDVILGVRTRPAAMAAQLLVHDLDLRCFTADAALHTISLIFSHFCAPHVKIA
jgi:hypothetical protein